MKTLIALTLLLLSLALAHTSSAQNNTYALIIGVSRYKNPGIKHLKYADKDALSFEKMLLSKAGGGLSRDNVKCLVNDSANFSKCRAEIQKIYRAAKSGDKIIFYFSGHGDAHTKEHPYLLLYDTPFGDPINYDGTALDIADLKSKYFKPLLAKGVKVTMITDACRTNEIAIENEFGVQFNDAMKENNGEIVFSSCQANQRSEEDERWGHGHGVFTWYLMQGWMGLADRNENEEVTVGELFDYVKDKVKKETFDFEKKTTRQVPGTCCEDDEDVVISKVDVETLKRLKEIEEGLKDTLDLVAYATKKSGGDYYDDDTAIMKIYNQLVASVSEDQILYPEDNCAYHYYLELKKVAKDKPIFFDGESELISALNAKGQDLLNEFINGADNHISINRIKTAYYYMNTGLEILSKDDPYYANFKIKSLFLESQYYMNMISSRNLALEKIDSAIAMQPRGAYLYFSKGLIYEKFLNYDSAITYYNRTIALAPKWPAPYYQRSLLLYSTGKSMEAIDRMNELLGKSNRGIALSTLGEFYYAIDSTQKAINFYLAALEKDSALTGACIGLYSSYRRLLKDSLANVYYSKAYILEPDNRSITIMDANYYMAIGEYITAETKYRKIYEDDSSDLYYLLKMGMAQYKGNKYTEAIATFERIRSLDPYYTSLGYSMINLFEAEEKYQESIEWHKYLMKIDPGYNPAGMYVPFKKLNMLDSANYYLELGYKKFPFDRYTLIMKAWHLRQEKNYTDAITIYNELVERKTATAEVFYGLAYCHYLLENKNDCLKYAYLAVKRDPYDLVYHEGLYIMLQHFGCSTDSISQAVLCPVFDHNIYNETYMADGIGVLFKIGNDDGWLKLATKGMETFPENMTFPFYLAVYCHKYHSEYFYYYMQYAIDKGVICSTLQDWKDYLPDPKKDGKYRKISKKICNH